MDPAVKPRDDDAFRILRDNDAQFFEKLPVRFSSHDAQAEDCLFCNSIKSLKLTALEK